jgi:Carboxypeptidase regulatory-like domain
MGVLSRVTVLVGVFLMLMMAQGVWGQVDSARLEGVVQDSSGAVIPNVKLNLVNLKTQSHAEAVSDSRGDYAFPSLQPGTYQMVVETAGFRKSVIDGIELNVAAVLSLPVKLEIGQTSETVEVQAGTMSVQTTDSQVSRAITLRDIDTLPSLGRSPIALAAYQPGVQINPGDTTFSHINGNRGGSNNATLDGIDVNDSLVPRLGLSLTSNNTDSIGEFRIVTTAGKAEYGRSAGGQVELITRSGSNSFHGNVFDYLRNTDLNANDFFNNQSGGAVPKLIQNTYGASVGGRIKRNKTFFFANWQGSRTRSETVRNRTVLSALAKQGIFQWKDANGVVQQYNIATNDPRHLGIDPTMVKNSIGLLPAANNADLGDGLNTLGFRFNNPTPSSSDQATGRIDHTLTDNHRLFFRWSDQHNTAVDSLNSADATFPGQAQGEQGGHRWGYSIGSDWNITPRTVNEARFGYQSASVEFLRPARLKGVTYISNSYTDPIASGFSQGRNSPVTEFTDNVTHLYNNHTFKAGINLRHTLQTGYNDAGIYPNITLSSTNNGNAPAGTVGPAGLSSTDRTRFNNLYNDVLGRADQSIETFLSNLKTFQAPGTTRQRDYVLFEQGYFFQDDWKIRRNLTLNIGVRWDIFGSPNEQNGLQGTLDQASKLTTSSQISNLTVVPSSNFYPTDKNNFAPRFGFAWDPFSNGKTAIRGNYGIFYDRNVGATVNSVDSGTPGFTQTAFVRPNVNGTDLRISDGIALPAVTGTPQLTLPATRSTGVTIYDPNLKTGYVEQYGLSIQHQIAANTIVDVGFVGERGKKLFFNLNLNQSRAYGDFLGAFKELQAFNANGTPVSANNTLVRMFGSPANAVSRLGATNLSQGLLGTVANNIDTTLYTNYSAGGVSDYYLRNFPQYTTLFYGTNTGLSWYDSLQLSVRRTTGMLKTNVNFTYSHTLDNTNQEGNGTSSPLDSFNLKLSKARGDFDRPMSLNSSVIFTPPVGRHQKYLSSMPRWADSVVGGWDVGALIVIQSAAPFSVTSGRATSASTVSSWANYSGDRNTGELQRRGDGVYFFTPSDVALFTFPGAGEIGNSGRNSFRGPTYYNVDASLVKRFKLAETRAVTFRAEAYNLFNHPQFGTPSLSLTTPSTFGKYSATLNGARTMQMALRFDF